MFDLQRDPCRAEETQLDDVEERLRAIAGQTGSDTVARALCAHVDGGGRRIRARMALRAASAMGCDGRAIATAAEALHQASLIHDDLSDGSHDRRGRAAIWSAHGPSYAVACGDLMIAGAFAALAAHGATAGRLVTEANRAVARTIRGQGSDLARREMSVAGWLATARRKSGPLLGIGPALVLIDAGRADLVARSRRSADWLAVAYQIADDFADEEEDRRCGAPNILPAMRARYGQAAARGAAVSLGHEALSRSEMLARRLPLGFDDVLATAAYPTRVRLFQNAA